MNEQEFPQGSVPVAVAARVYHVMRDGLPALLCEPFNLRWVGTVE